MRCAYYLAILILPQPQAHSQARTATTPVAELAVAGIFTIDEKQ